MSPNKIKKSLSSGTLLRTNARIELWNEKEVVNLIRPKQSKSVNDTIKQASIMSRKSYDKPLQQQTLLENKNRLIQIFKDFKLDPYLSPLINHLNAQVALNHNNNSINNNNNRAYSNHDSSNESHEAILIEQSLLENSAKLRHNSFGQTDKVNGKRPQFHIHIPQQPPMTPAFYKNLPDNPPATPLFH